MDINRNRINDQYIHMRDTLTYMSVFYILYRSMTYMAICCNNIMLISYYNIAYEYIIKDRLWERLADSGDIKSFHILIRVFYFYAYIILYNCILVNNYNNYIGIVTKSKNNTRYRLYHGPKCAL